MISFLYAHIAYDKEIVLYVAKWAVTRQLEGAGCLRGQHCLG